MVESIGESAVHRSWISEGTEVKLGNVGRDRARIGDLQS